MEVTEFYLKRFELTPRSTIGHLHVGAADSAPRCFTIEDAMREVAGRPVSEWKIPGQTAIPVGRYEVIINWSNRFKRQMPLLLSVPGYEGVRIHVANTDADVQGCIGVGHTHPKPDFIGDSFSTWSLLFIEMEAILRRGKLFITILNP